MSAIRFDRPVTAVRIASAAAKASLGAPKPPPGDAVTAKLEAAIRDVQRGLAAERDRVAALEAELEREAVALALAAVERVVGEEVQNGRARLEALIAPAIEDALARRGAGRLTVRLHPEDLEALRQRTPDFVAGSGVEFRGDPAVVRGSAIVDSAAGTLETGVSVAVNRLRQELLGGGA